MENEPVHSSDVAFTHAVKAVQNRRGSRRAYAKQEERGGWATVIDADLKRFVEAQTSVFLATASSEGQPYIQHRGGPAGFLRVIDESTVGFVDFTGNRQYVTTGNLAENPKAFLFLIDYAARRRIKIWGSARVVEGNAELTAKLMPANYKARAEQIILFAVTAWDANCAQHIPLRFEAADVISAIGLRDQRIADLETELAAIRTSQP
jgi:predicted pyridoxine 5'-phosphate oxidase superfamily flavin-nucleotide-binding protein